MTDLSANNSTKTSKLTKSIAAGLFAVLLFAPGAAAQGALFDSATSAAAGAQGSYHAGADAAADSASDAVSDAADAAQSALAAAKETQAGIVYDAHAAVDASGTLEDASDNAEGLMATLKSYAGALAAHMNAWFGSSRQGAEGEGRETLDGIAEVAAEASADVQAKSSYRPTFEAPPMPEMPDIEPPQAPKITTKAVASMQAAFGGLLSLF